MIYWWNFSAQGSVNSLALRNKVTFTGDEPMTNGCAIPTVEQSASTELVVFVTFWVNVKIDNKYQRFTYGVLPAKTRKNKLYILLILLYMAPLVP